MLTTSDKVGTCGKRYLTMEQLCDYLSISRWTIQRMISKREIPFSQISSKLYRFDREKIDKWIADCSMKTVEEV